jgi:hypothetical protein
MRATQAIQVLQELIAEHGDLDVAVWKKSGGISTKTELEFHEDDESGRIEQRFVLFYQDYLDEDD